MVLKHRSGYVHCRLVQMIRWPPETKNSVQHCTMAPVLYMSNSTGGAMPDLGTKPRRLTPAQQFRETGLRRQASFFGAACEKISGATHALQIFLKSHSYQHFQANMPHFFNSSGKPYCNRCTISLSRAAYIHSAAAFASQASLCFLRLVCTLKSFKSFQLRSTGDTFAF
jgi:hypothetical protein